MKTVIATLQTIAFAMTAALGVSVVTVRPATAQTPVSWVPSVYVGAANPMGDNTATETVGYTAGAGLDVGASRSLFLRAEGSYTRLGGSSGAGASSDVSGRINAVIAGRTSHLAFVPYAIAGVGIYRVRPAESDEFDYGPRSNVDYTAFDATSDGSAPSNKVGLNAGAGVEIPGGAIASRLEVRYHRLMSTDASRSAYLTVTLGLALVRH